MVRADVFVTQMASLLAEAERQHKTLGTAVTRMIWFYSERTGVDYIQLLDAIMWTFQNYRGSTPTPE